MRLFNATVSLIYEDAHGKQCDLADRRPRSGGMPNAPTSPRCGTARSRGSSCLARRCGCHGLTQRALLCRSSRSPGKRSRGVLRANTAGNRSRCLIACAEGDEDGIPDERRQGRSVSAPGVEVAAPRLRLTAWGAWWTSQTSPGQSGHVRAAERSFAERSAASVVRGVLPPPVVCR